MSRCAKILVVIAVIAGVIGYPRWRTARQVREVLSLGTVTGVTLRYAQAPNATLDPNTVLAREGSVAVGNPTQFAAALTDAIMRHYDRYYPNAAVESMPQYSIVIQSTDGRLYCDIDRSPVDGTGALNVSNDRGPARLHGSVSIDSEGAGAIMRLIETEAATRRTK